MGYDALRSRAGISAPIAAVCAQIGLPYAAIDRIIRRIMSGEKLYLRQTGDWPNWRFDAAALASPLAAVHRAQGHLAGRMVEFGGPQRDEGNRPVSTAIDG